MDFDATEFLAGLFGGAVPAAGKPAGQASSPKGDPAAEDPAADDPFAGWVRRQDVTGRWGWEAPKLPEWQRWWARFQFEDLPEPPVAWGKADQQETTPQVAPSCVSRAADATIHLPGIEPSDRRYGPLTAREDR
jgi:hypothetical protein